MANIFKASGYFVDVNNNYTLEDINSLIFNGWTELKPRHTHTEMEKVTIGETIILF